jgi:MOSC domain-containing protein YiiM
VGATTSRPAYVPQFGQTRCGRRGAWHCGHSLCVGADSLCVERRLFVRAWDCFCLGTAIAGDEDSGEPLRLGTMGTVLSVNVGRPAPFRIGGHIIPSAFVKHPVAGPVAVGPLGLDGDGQADRVNHGGVDQAVYAYASEDAEWWAERLGRPLRAAAFGENLTLAGLPVSDAEIGERWRIGDAELVVTAPRVPCSKLAASMGDPRFVRAFARAGRPGAYFSVAGTGRLAAGDEVRILEHPGHGVTAAAMLEITLFDRGRAAELEPARPWMHPRVAAWLDEQLS